MDDQQITFEEDKWKQQPQDFHDKVPKIISLVIRMSGGAIQDEKQASYVLATFAVLLFIVSIFIFWHQSSLTVQSTVDVTHINQSQFSNFQ